MGFFSKFTQTKQEEEYDYFSSRDNNDAYNFGDRFNREVSSESKSENDDDEDDTDCPEYEIVFWEELKDGLLVFQIIDEDFDPAGHIIARNSTDIKILESGMYNFEREDLEYLRDKVKEFCKALGKF